MSLLYLCISACALGSVLYFERRRVPACRGRLITPAVLVAGSIGLVYAGPLLLAEIGFNHPGFYPARLRAGERQAVSRLIATFSLCIAAGFFAYSFSAHRARRARSDPGPLVGPHLLVLLLAAAATNFIYLGVPVGFDPGTIVDRAVNPREYTALRAGTGYLTYLRAISMPLAASATALWAMNPRSKRRYGMLRFAPFVAATVLMIAGGSKTTVVSPLLFGLLAAEEVRYRSAPSAGALGPLTRPRRRRHVLLRFLTGTAVTIAVMVAAFSLMRTDSQDASGVTVGDHLVTYQREAYHTAQVVRDFTWSGEQLLRGLADAPLAMVPSALYPEKPAVGFYFREWKPRYEADRADYHVSTYGVLAEAHMMFGAFGPVIAAGILVAWMAWIYRLLLLRGQFYHFFVAGFLLYWTFFAVRSGFFGSPLVYVFMVVAGSRVWLRGLMTLFGRQRYFTGGPVAAFAVDRRHPAWRTRGQ